MAENTGQVYVQDGRKPEADIKRSSWLLFPDGKNYLIAKYCSNLHIKPKFTGGELKLDIEHPSAAVSQAVEAFASALEYPSITEDGPVLMLAGVGLDMYVAFLKMLRVLLLENYDWDDAKLNQVLEFTPKQYSSFLRPVLQKVFYGD